MGVQLDDGNDDIAVVAVLVTGLCLPCGVNGCGGCWLPQSARVSAKKTSLLQTTSGCPFVIAMYNHGMLPKQSGCLYRENLRKST